MIKKILIITIMFIFSILLYAPSVQAASVLVPEPAANAGGLWHVEDGNRVYINMRYTDGETVIETGSFSDSEHPEYDYSLYTYWPDFRENDLSFPNSTSLKTANISNPNPTIYDKFTVEIIANMTSEYGLDPSYKEIISYTSAVNDVSIELFDKNDLSTNCFFDYSFLKLSVDGDEVLSSRQLSEAKADVCLEEMGPFPYPVPEANPNYEDLAFGVRMYWEKSDTAEEIDPGATNNPWEVLPVTTGSPINPMGDWGTVSDINIENQSISFNIIYSGTEYPVLPFSVNGDLSFVNESNDVLYYSDPITGDKMLYFNFGDTLDSAILTASSFSDVTVWKGEALWNLTQNEIKVTDVLTVYNYIPNVDADGNVYSYFYMPDVPLDNLISVSAILAYRYWDDGFLGIGELEPGEIQYKTVAAVRGETTSVNPSWVEDTYKGAYITSALFGLGAVSGVVPGYGWVVAGAAFLVGGVLQVSDVNEWFAYDVEQIEHVIPGVALTNEINSYITEISGNDTFTADTDKLYKLHFATLNENDEVQIMNELSNVTQVVWETDGEIYVLNQENIENPDWGGPGTLIPQDSIGNDDLEMIIWIGAGVAGLYIFSSLKLDKKPGLMVLIIAAALYILYEMGLL